ncbi:hypothetical protein ACFFJN_11115 [Erwinia mallotivora]|uniref:hypothetical protein n=1 Tax=Erwinia mallotivora TaxID=69222 RepID=UPI0035E4A229
MNLNALIYSMNKGLLDNKSESIVSVSVENLHGPDGEIEGRLVWLRTEKPTKKGTNGSDSGKKETSVELITLGMNPVVARLISDFNHRKYLENSDKFATNDMIKSKKYVALLTDFIHAEENAASAKELVNEFIPVELKEIIPAKKELLITAIIP